MLAALGLLIVSAALTPDARGHGTHLKLGLPVCGFVLAFNKPCMTCGMTTSFALAANGRLLTALAVQPAGAILAVLTASTAWLAGLVALLGLRVHAPLAPLARPRMLLIVGGVLLLAWAYKWFIW